MKTDEDLAKINEIPSLQTSDSAILANIIFQCVIAVVVFIIFIPFRKKMLWLYSPNTKNKKTHPAYKRSKSYLAWMWPVISTNDVVLLNIIGLDSFMMLQTLKLMYRIFMILSVMLIPLAILYFKGDQARYDQYFLEFTIQNVRRRMFYVPLLYVYLITFVIFYLIFIYYKKHVSIRQAYIRAPSVLTSLTCLKRLSFEHKNYLDHIDIKTRTVFMMRIPHFIETDRELRVFVEAMGVGTVENCVLVQDTRKIDALTNQRDILIRDIEGEIERTWRNILKNIKQGSRDKENMKEIYAKFKEMDAKLREIEIAHGDGKVETTPVNNPESLAKQFLYSKNKYIKRYGKMDALTYKMNKLTQLQNNMINEISVRLRVPVEEKRSEQIIELMNKNNLMYTRVDIANDVSFFSLHQMFYLREHWHAFTIDLPFYAKTAFVTFIDPKSAQILPQCLISSRVFSCKALPAPVPQDVIWENINRGEVEIYFKKLFGNVVLIIFNLAFYTLVLGVINLIDLDTLEYHFPSIKAVTTIKSVRSLFNGIVTPLIFNTLLIIAPVVLTLLTYYEGICSYSGLYIRLTERFGYFLIFNCFLSFLCSSTFVGMAQDIWQKEATFSQFTNSFGNNLIKLSIFFTNTIIQKMVLGNIFAVLKPVKLGIEIFSDKILTTFGSVRSRRSTVEVKLADNANFGVLYPNLIIIFPIALTYSVIAPMMVLLACVYFFVTYFVYKEEFLYALTNEFESGGTYWDVVSNQMLISIFIFQIAMMCQFAVRNATLEASLIVPLILVTYMYRSSLKSMFGRSTTFYPLNEQEEMYVDDFTNRLIEVRKGMVEQWNEELDPVDANIVACDDILDKAENEKIINYPYRGSLEGVKSIMFPVMFFEKLEIIKEHDPNDELGIFKEFKGTPKS